MPQASDEDRARYKTYFPDIGPEHAMQTLEERGYKLTKDGHRGRVPGPPLLAGPPVDRCPCANRRQKGT